MLAGATQQKGGFLGKNSGPSMEGAPRVRTAALGLFSHLLERSVSIRIPEFGLIVAIRGVHNQKQPGQAHTPL